MKITLKNVFLVIYVLVLLLITFSANAQTTLTQTIKGSVLDKAYDDNDDTQQPTELADPSTVGLSIFETNVLGVARTTRAFLPLLCNDGRVINVGSYFGSIAGAIGIGVSVFHCLFYKVVLFQEKIHDGI